MMHVLIFVGLILLSSFGGADAVKPCCDGGDVIAILVGIALFFVLLLAGIGYWQRRQGGVDVV
jgi:hypothetical protein